MPDPVAPTRLRGVTILTERPQETRDFIARFGYRPGPAAGAIQRMVSDTDVVDIRDAAGFFPAIAGTGTLDHVAFRAADADALRAMRLALKDSDATTLHDRKYFQSLYVREPGGTLLEHATDGPGLVVDEAPAELGRTLFVPPQDAARADDLRVILPQFAMPGEERHPMRDLHFVHRFHRPAQADGSTIVLLHGTGGNEADLMPLAHRIAPNATLLGVRGRSTEEGINRWFRRYNAVAFDQADVRAEAEAFAGFIEAAARAYGLDPRALVHLGYSNGANLLGAVLQLYPGLIRRAVLIRAVQVLEDPPALEAQALAGSRVLMLTGSRDPFARMGPALERALQDGGAALDARTIEAGHELQPDDLTAATDWLARD